MSVSTDLFRALANPRVTSVLVSSVITGELRLAATDGAQLILKRALEYDLIETASAASWKDSATLLKAAATNQIVLVSAVFSDLPEATTDVEPPEPGPDPEDLDFTSFDQGYLGDGSTYTLTTAGHLFLGFSNVTSFEPTSGGDPAALQLDSIVITSVGDALPAGFALHTWTAEDSGRVQVLGEEESPPYRLVLDVADDPGDVPDTYTGVQFQIECNLGTAVTDVFIYHLTST